MPSLRPRRDAELVQIVDAALADATMRAGKWLACRPGCTQCCHGVFAISALDAARLRESLDTLRLTDPQRADRLRVRAAAARRELSAGFPGDPASGILGASDEDRQLFLEFGNEAACPVLDPETGRCDLYAGRPMTCRVFGPPVPGEEGIGMCELCFVGAAESDVLAAVMVLEHSALEEELTVELEQETGQAGSTIIAFALDCQ